MFRFMLPFLFETPGGGSGGGGEGGGDGGGEGGGQESGLYSEALANVPEELHPYVTEQFKKWDSTVTPKLQEAAKLRDQYGPLSEIDGLSDIPPEELSSLLEFRNMVSQVDEDPTAFVEWLNNANEAMGLAPGELDEDAWLAMGEEKGWFAGDDGGEQVPQDPRVDQLLQEAEQMRQWIAQRESSDQQSQSVAEAKQQMEASLASALEKSGLEGNARDEYAQQVIEIAQAFAEEDDPIGMAVERINKIRGGAEGERADRDLNQPETALSGGRADTSPREFKSFDDPDLKAAATARLRG